MSTNNEEAWEMQNNFLFTWESSSGSSQIDFIFDSIWSETLCSNCGSSKKRQSLLAIGGENDCLAVGDCEQNKIVFP